MKFRQKFGLPVLLGTVLTLGSLTSALAEVSEVAIAQQYGISYLPLMIMQENKLLEKETKAAGLGDVKVTWAKFAGGNVMNDALLSGDLQFASGGLGPFITLWAKTRNNIGVKAIGAMNSMPLLLNTNNPDIKSLKDFTEKDKIALPAVKVSIQAITLQMAAEKEFGAGQANRLDALTVTQSHPDGMLAMLGGGSPINSHFTAPPFQYVELEKPGMHTVLNSYDVTGGPHTFNVVWASTRFVTANPKTYAAFLRAFDSAIALINKDKQAAAEFYVKAAKTKESVAFIEKMLNDPNIEFTTTPKNSMKYAEFMQRIGMIKVKPSSWKEMFFPNVRNLPGS
ncbi:ABC transporter substrate-binding protein [Glaciimonas sp. CA11.2]|uniref:ABC transporter substrate-binding protein n=1 Tax=Glaciimonas sp. CA11.2 TaxID=3048601 RepID=UPI002AB57798|nr:ABC transporter substrate-binding protein [Glaciimonas sp. CA11.2]MDY7548357.1 ABC transporter substrate-binding protein [Glaciimonas sp. CA11.2]MEB0164137.1 ABC transporter substrate-binding protein [Glaciimonas sp. CA11.2]